MSITLVQGPKQGKATILSGTFTTTLTQTPANGNLLILDFMGSANGNNPELTNVSQTGVTWSQVVTPDSGSTSIWMGTVGSSASTVMTLTIASGSGGDLIELVDVCEWSGLSGVVDRTASNAGGSGTALDTGTTSATSQANELFVGLTRGAVVTSGQSAAQSSPTNGFTLLDGSNVADGSGNNASLGYLYKIVSAEGTANSGTTAANNVWWTGCIATFKATSSGGNLTTADIASGQPFTVTNGALSLDVSSPLQVSTGSLSMTNGNLNGTTNQVNVSGGTGAVIGSGVTLSLPQNINTGASPIFAGLNIENGSGGAGTYGYLGLGDVNPMLVKAYGYPLGINHESPAIIAASASSALLFDASLGSNGVLTGYWTALQSKGSNVLQLAPSGSVTTRNSTVDDGSGNMTLSAGSTLSLYTPASTQYPNGLQLTLQAKYGMSSSYPYPVLYAPGAGLEADDIIADGVLWTTGANLENNTGGGALLMQYGYSNGTDMPVIWLTDPNHSTLWLRAATYSNWASLELQNLTVNGSLIANGQFLDAYSPLWISGVTQAGTSSYGYLNSSGAQGYQSGSSGNVNLSLYTAGRIFCGGEIDVYSDQRDKNFVETLNAQTALSAVNKLNPLHFSWKTETQRENGIVAGFFAQEVARAIPEAITVYEGKRYPDEHTLNYNILTTYALSAIQGLAKEVGDLRLQIRRLSKAGAS